MIGGLLDIISIGLVFFLGAIVILRAAKIFKIGQARALILYSWHSLFCIIFSALVWNNGGDALHYYQASITEATQSWLGTSAIYAVTSIPAYWLGLSFIATSMIFNILGTVGLIAFDATLQPIVASKSRFTQQLAYFAPFLPSMSFWSSGIGKDSLSFMGICLAIWAMQSIKTRSLVFAFAVMLTFFVRPHIGGLLLICFGSGFVFGSRLSVATKSLFAFLASVAAFFVVPVAIGYAGLDENASIDDINEIIERRQELNMAGGSSLDIGSMSRPVRIFSYLFRPLFLDAKNSQALISSLENAAILLFLFVSIRFLLTRNFFKFLGTNIFYVFYFLSTTIVLSETTANLGIAVRQKWMIIPVLFIILFSIHPNILRKSYLK
jgi:hypothetical protein